MKQTIKIEKPWNGKYELTPTDAIQIQHDSHSSYAFTEYVRDIMSEFEATREEAEKIVRDFFKMKQ